MAQRKAVALTDAFEQRLGFLRQDEIARRTASMQETIKGYQANLQAARQRIFEMQQKSGLVSVDQFNEVATSLEETRKKLAEAGAEAVRLDASQKALAMRLGMDARLASLALSLSADPVFAKALADYADLSALVGEQVKMFGPRNPLLLQSRARQSAAREALVRLARNSGVGENDISRMMVALAAKEREELLKEVVAGEAQAQGKKREVEAFEHELERLEQQLHDLTSNAARLEDLKKDHLIAEAVFSSALARVDTNKADLFSSYPIVQTLAAPDLPSRPSQPRPLYAILGGVVGTLLAVAAWTLAWLRQTFIQKLLKRK